MLLEKAKAQPDFTQVSFRSYEGYTERFSREEATKHLLFLAFKVNGELCQQPTGILFVWLPRISTGVAG